MKTKITLVLFLFLMLAGMFFSFFLFAQWKETNIQLGKSNLELEKMNLELAEKKQALEFEKNRNDSLEKRQTIKRIRDSFPKFWLHAKIITKSDSAKRSQKEKYVQSKLDNANYYVGIYALGAIAESFNKTVEYLDYKGFSIVAKIELDSKPTWLASSSTVFYYDDSTQYLAQNLANDIGEMLQTHFNIQKGEGIGVPEGKEKQYIYIHLIGTSSQ